MGLLRATRERARLGVERAALLREALTAAPFSGKVTTPYAPGSVHDYMHAKVTVVDNTVFVGSFNLSHSGELALVETGAQRILPTSLFTRWSAL